MRIGNDSIDFDTTDLAQATATSSPIWVGHVSQYAIQIVATGVPVGVFKLQVSCDLGPRDSNAAQTGQGLTNWSDLTDATAAVSAAGISFLNIADAGYDWVRVVYTKTSGTGAISSARFNTKGV